MPKVYVCGDETVPDGSYESYGAASHPNGVVLLVSHDEVWDWVDLKNCTAEAEEERDEDDNSPDITQCEPTVGCTECDERFECFPARFQRSMEQANAAMDSFSATLRNEKARREAKAGLGQPSSEAAKGSDQTAKDRQLIFGLKNVIERALTDYKVHSVEIDGETVRVSMHPFVDKRPLDARVGMSIAQEREEDHRQ
jgi:hypothetical protein